MHDGAGIALHFIGPDENSSEGSYTLFYPCTRTWREGRARVAPQSPLGFSQLRWLISRGISGNISNFWEDFRLHLSSL